MVLWESQFMATIMIFIELWHKMMHWVTCAFIVAVKPLRYVCTLCLWFTLWGLLGMLLWYGLNSISGSRIVVTTRPPACTWDQLCDQKLMIDLEWPYKQDYGVGSTIIPQNEIIIKYYKGCINSLSGCYIHHSWAALSSWLTHLAGRHSSDKTGNLHDSCCYQQ